MEAASNRWYSGITRYQWLVLVIASLGWVFDVFEGQIFVASMNEAMPDLAPAEVRALNDKEQKGYIAFYNNVTFACFLLGGSLGGVLFGIISDRIGRKRAMAYTILIYSLFTFISALSLEWWHMAIFRFLVAMGVGGEWAVATALVAEVFPQRARAWSLGIFHASSVFGTYLAIAAGIFIIGNPMLDSEAYPTLKWRLGFVIGALPALLIIWIRLSLREPERWQRAKASADELTRRLGSFVELFSPDLRRRTIVGVVLAAVGLATFWGAHVYGKDLMRRDYIAQLLQQHPEATTEASQKQIVDDNENSIKRWEMLGMFLVTTGGGLGLVSFGPLAEWLGRRGAFLFFHLGGLAVALIAFQHVSGIETLFFVLPVFGFLTLGAHAGYAVYFPELFPTRLRGTGSGFCFNFGRLLAAPVLILKGLLQRQWGFSLEDAASLLSLLFLVGVVTLAWAPETKGHDLPE